MSSTPARNSKEAARRLRLKVAALINSGMSYREIAEQTGASLGLVAKVKKMMEDPDRDIEYDAREENQKPEYFDEAMRQKIIDARKEYGFGARLLWALITRNPDEFGLAPEQIPSTATISRWLEEEKLTRRPIGPKDRRYYPTDYQDEEGHLVMDGWGPYHAGSDRVYLVTCQDRYTRLTTAVGGKTDKTTDNWTHALYMARKHLLMGATPRVLQVDNGIGMQLANGWTPQPVRHAMKMGTRVTFIPPGQPWRNGRLENWHHRMEVECMRPAQPRNTSQALHALAGYINWYNVDRPHSSLKYKAPADTAEYLPITIHEMATIPQYEKLDPQKGVIDLVRLVMNDGYIELMSGDYTRISSVFGGAFVRLRFFCDPTTETQLGEIIWRGGKDKEPLIVATFNHKIDRSRKRGEPLITELRMVDFTNADDAEQPPTQLLEHWRLDEGQADNQRARIAKRRRNERPPTP